MELKEKYPQIYRKSISYLSTYYNNTIIPFYYIEEDDEYYYVAPQMPIRIPKSEMTFNKKEALFEVMENRLLNGQSFSSKQNREVEVIERLKKKHPQYFI